MEQRSLFNEKWDRKQVETTDGMPGRFMQHNHISITKLENGMAEGELTVTENALNGYGYIHGGCLSALADAVCGWAVSRGTGRRCVTANMMINYLRPASGKKIICLAQPQKIGRYICVYNTVMSNDEGVEVANGSLTLFLIPEDNAANEVEKTNV